MASIIQKPGNHPRTLRLSTWAEEDRAAWPDPECTANHIEATLYEAHESGTFAEAVREYAREPLGVLLRNPCLAEEARKIKDAKTAKRARYKLIHGFDLEKPLTPPKLSYKLTRIQHAAVWVLEELYSALEVHEQLAADPVEEDRWEDPSQLARKFQSAEEEDRMGKAPESLREALIEYLSVRNELLKERLVQERENKKKAFLEARDRPTVSDNTRKMKSMMVGARRQVISGRATQIKPFDRWQHR